MTNVPTIAHDSQSRMTFTQKVMRKLAAVTLCCSTLALTACGTTAGPTIINPATRFPTQQTQPLPTTHSAEPQVAALPDATEDVDTGAEVIQSTRIGVLLPLSGDAAKAGQGLRNAALLAQFDVNNPGMVLQFYDTKGTPQGALEAAQQAVSHGVSLFVGPLFSHSVQAVTPVAQSMNIPILSFSTNPAVVSNSVYVTGFLITPQIERIVGFAAEQGRTDYAILAPQTAYGQAAAQAAQTAIQKFGGNLVRTVSFDPHKINFADAIREVSVFDSRKRNLQIEKAKLRGKTDPASKAALKRLDKLDTLGDVDFDTLILPMAGSTLQQVATLLKYYDVDTDQVKLLGTLLWQDANLGKETALQGAWYPAASRVGYTQFINRYTETFKQAPSQLSSLSYDMVTLAAALSQQSTTPWSLLTAPGGFIGVNGAFRLEYDGRVQRMMAVREVQPTGSRVVSPAPTTFATMSEAPF